MARLDLVPIYATEWRGLLDRLGGVLEQQLPFTVEFRAPWFDPEISFDAQRGQYNSTALLRLLLDTPNDGAARVLGVASVDLCTSILTYVFGEAQLGGKAAVVSLHRLRSDVYGLPGDEELLFQRLLKETVHELGHTFGLVHCPDSTCVMYRSTYVEEIDFKPATYCAECQDSVASALSGR